MIHCTELLSRHRPSFLPGLLAAAGLVLVGPAGAAEEPSVVLITVDTLRADRLSCSGYERPTSPRIDALLEAGVRFTRARTIEPLTNPALCSMLTGVPPHRHGATRNGLRMEDGLESLPKILDRAGWRTAAVVSNWTLKDKLSNLAEHFQDYLEVFTRKRWLGLLNSEATATDVTNRAIRWVENHLEKESERRFLLWVHYVEPHAPYLYQEKFAERLGIHGASPSKSDRYDTEIAAVDHEIGRLLDRLRQYIPEQQLLLFFAADHGESLGEHSYWGHGRNLYEPNLAIPMGFAWPGRIVPGTLDGPATILDLPRTVLELLGKPVPDAMVGVSWAGALTGGPSPADNGLCYQAHKGAVKGDHDSDQARSKGLLSVGYVRAERKEILRLRSSAHRLFDVEEDPGELRSLVPAGSDPSPELMRCVGEISEGLGALDRLVDRKLDPKEIEKLRALGYIE